MSYELEIPAPSRPSLGALRDALSLSELDGLPDGGEWPSDTLQVHLRGVSTRATTIAWEGELARVVIRALASPEDAELALRITEALARLSGTPTIRTEGFGELPVEALRARHRGEWLSSQAESGTFVVAEMIRQGEGPMGLPGPVRHFWMGERILGELERGGAKEELPNRVVEAMRRVQWNVPARYRGAGVFVAGERSEGKKETRFAVWLPDEHLVLPRVDHVALRAAHGDVVMVPFDAVPELAAGVGERLDECQWLLSPVDAAGWAEIVARARQLRRVTAG